jgi:hypothetical protein
MSSTAFPASVTGLPASLKYDLPPSMSDSARSYSVNVAPDGQNTVTGPTGIAAPFVVNSVGAFGQYTAQNISFTIPSGMSDSVFLDPVSTTLSFTLSYSIATAIATPATAGQMNLIGSAASWFDQLVLYSNNTPIETINQYGLLQNYLLQNTVSQSERFGGISTAMGADSNSANGIDLAYSGTVNTAYRYNFCIPLLSVIGVNSDKLFPVGSVNNLQLVMTTANITPVTSQCGATAPTTNPVLSAFVLSEFQLNMKYVDVGDIAAQQLRQTLQDGKWYMKSTTYTNSSVAIGTGATGNSQLLLQIRNTSVKSILHQFGVAQQAACPNGYYDAVNPSLTSRQCQVGGSFYPNRPINDSQRPAEGYTYLIQALGGGIAKSLGTCVSASMYNAVLPSIPTGSDTRLVVPAAGFRTPTASHNNDEAQTQITKFPNSAFYGYDLEKVSSILFSGVNTRAQPPFINLTLAGAAPAGLICQAWGMSDVVLVFDAESKQVTAFI